MVTGEIREGDERVAFEVVTLDGRTGPLASIKNSRYLPFVSRSLAYFIRKGRNSSSLYCSQSVLELVLACLYK